MAGNSASQANTSANNASASATQAGTYAGNASTSATQAQGYANDASASATLADGYADSASDSATAAQGYASDASDSADSASASAEEAKEYADQTERSIPSHVRLAIYTLLENAAYATTGLTDEIEVVQSWAEEVQSLVLSDTELELEEDTPQVITAVTIPYGATVSWTTSNPEVATVDSGIVTGGSNGSCTITASAGDLSATCNVSVSGFVELVSISAVYTQSGTVYDTDSLDSLKADLVVTATYSDSSTETVTTYTLSGTLTDGTSTITVVYGGKTTTFSVSVTGWDYYNYSIYNCQLVKVIGSTGFRTNEKLIELDPAATNRRSFPTLLNAVQSLKNKQTSWGDTDYYPIPIPADAVSATVSITPNTQFHGVSIYTFNTETNKYERKLDPGWKQGSYTYTFTAGQYEYITVASKYNSAGSSYPEEPTEVTIEFLTE